jgi:opine dehydrogenase
MKIAILGGGAIAHAAAADLTQAGHEIRMAELPEYGDNVLAIRAYGGIHVKGTALMGGAPSLARISLVTTDMSEALYGTELILVHVPAFAHRAFMSAMLPYLEPGQAIVFSSGYFASLVFAKMLIEAGRATDDLLIGETTSTLYMARLLSPGRVWLRGGKSRMPFSALPASRTQELLNRIHQVYPQLQSAQNVFETSMTEPGIVVHPVSTLLNLSRIEQIGPYRYDNMDVTPAVGRVMDAVDSERKAVQQALGLRGLTVPDLFYAYFGTRGENSLESLRARPVDQGGVSPDGSSHRYLTEDVPYGLVPIASIGALFNVETPLIRGIVELASAACNIDFWEVGRNTNQMGLEGMTREEILRYVS